MHFIETCGSVKCNHLIWFPPHLKSWCFINANLLNRWSIGLLKGPTRGLGYTRPSGYSSCHLGVGRGLLISDLDLSEAMACRLHRAKKLLVPQSYPFTPSYLLCVDQKFILRLHTTLAPKLFHDKSTSVKKHSSPSWLCQYHPSHPIWLSPQSFL